MNRIKVLTTVVHRILQWLQIAFLLLLSACSDTPQTGAVDVRFDRDICERCRMVLSDPRFSAQVRYVVNGRSRVSKFDDIGCAVIWLQEQKLQNNNQVEIWVTDYQTRDWIDARKATYVKVGTTPMEYGLGAMIDSTVTGMNFEQATDFIFDVEKRFNIHGQQLQQRLREQAELRKNQQ